MVDECPSVEGSLRARAVLYFGIAQYICGVSLLLTIGTDAWLKGLQTELLLVRGLEFALPTLLFAYGIRSPKHHYILTTVALGWWAFFDTTGNLFSNGLQSAVIMATLLVAAAGLFAQRAHLAILRIVLLVSLILSAILIEGSAIDEPTVVTLTVGAFAGVVLSWTNFKNEERSVRIQEVAWRAKREAEGAALSRVEFLGRMSHELRTPLNGVLGMLQLLREDGPLNADQQEDLRIAKQSSTQLLTLVTDILDFSAMTTGQSTASPVPTRLHPLLEDRVAELREAVPDLRIDLLASSLPPGLLIDGPRVMRVVDVLLANAAKFTHRGSIRIQVAFADDLLTVEVMDTGVGLPKDASKLFDAFEQGDGTKTRRYGGAGLGLAISKHLAESMDGTLSARTRMGHGSIFTLSVPTQICTAPSLSTQGHGRRLRGHLLIVEDNPINQMVLKGLLQSIGLSSATSNNGKEALSRVEHESFDGILMDFHMPVMDGMEATRRLRAMGLDLPIIGVSASVMPQDKRAAIASGMDHTLGKPVNRDVLEATLADYLPAACISRHTSVA